MKNLYLRTMNKHLIRQNNLRLLMKQSQQRQNKRSLMLPLPNRSRQPKPHQHRKLHSQQRQNQQQILEPELPQEEMQAETEIQKDE
jgi:hypothetical protein